MMKQPSSLTSGVTRTGALVLAGLTLGAIAPTEQAQAYPLNPWGAKTADKSVAITPFLYVYNGGKDWYPYFYAGYGVGPKLDIMAGVGAGLTFGDEVSVGLSAIELFPRFFFAESWAAVAHFYYSPGSLIVAPEIHGVYTADKFALTVNAGYRPVFTFGEGGGFSAGSVNVILAPEYNFSSQFSVFLEIDPVFGFGTDEDGNFAVSPSVTLVPGIGFALDPDQTHVFSVGAQIVLPAAEGANFFQDNVSFGIWYATVFGGGGESSEARARSKQRFTALNSTTFQ